MSAALGPVALRGGAGGGSTAADLFGSAVALRLGAGSSAPGPAWGTLERMATSRRGRTATLTALAVVLVGVLLYAGAILVAPTERSDGVCEGIGFGCSPAPRDALIILAVIGALPMLLCLSAACSVGVLALLRWTRLPGVAVGLIGGIGGVLLATVGTLGLLMLL